MKRAFAFLLFAGLSGFTSAEPAKVSIKGAQVEIYKVASGDELKLYIINPKGHEPKTDRRAAIVFFFGGAWNGGTPTQFEQHSRYLAAREMVAMVADYRVKSRQGTPPSACVKDGKSAIRYIRKHAERLGVDPDRIAAGGGSAGGHVAAATGMIDGFEDENDDHSISSKANALALFNPVYDNGPTGWGHTRVEEYWQEISPAHNITKDDPPAIVFLGSQDALIPVATAEKFKGDMEQLGLKSELHVYEGQPHGFFNEKKGGTEIFFDTIRKMDHFLVGVGYLKGGVDEKALLDISKPKAPKKTRKPKDAKQVVARIEGRIKDLDGKTQQPFATEEGGVSVLFFITHDCPISNGYAPEFRRLREQYSDSRAAMFLVYVDPDAKLDELKEHQRDFSLTQFTAIHDATHRLVRATGATVTPEAVIIGAEGRIEYRGRVDNLYADFGERRRKATVCDLRNALDELKSGKPVKNPRTEAIGCYIPTMPVK